VKPHILYSLGRWVADFRGWHVEARFIFALSENWPLEWSHLIEIGKEP
jgi:hypothetical protein